jgi:DNA polymerase III subunit epsilon
MVRASTQLAIADIGGNIGGNVNRDNDFLIVRQQDNRIAGDDRMSSKQEKKLQCLKFYQKMTFLEICSKITKYKYYNG